MFLVRPLLVLGLMGVLAMAGLGCNDANAQQIYRLVGPDGRVTFSDKAPLDANTKATLARGGAPGGGSSLESLPFELRQVASRFPVTIYTGPGCGPCGAGRALLSSRGVPFAEKTVTSNDDIEALKRLSNGAASLPFLTIGGQQLRGFSEVEWVQFLDAAGYPKNSLLPASYTPSPASPLVAVQEPVRAPQAAPAETARAAQPDSIPLQAPGDNPSGIRF